MRNWGGVCNKVVNNTPGRVFEAALEAIIRSDGGENPSKVMAGGTRKAPYVKT